MPRQIFKELAGKEMIDSQYRKVVVLWRVEPRGINEFWNKEYTMESAFTPLICMFGAMLLVIAIFLAVSIRIVREDTRLSVYRLGRYIGEKGPGLVVLIPFIDRVVKKEVGMHDENAPDTWSRG